LSTVENPSMQGPILTPRLWKRTSDWGRLRIVRYTFFWKNSRSLR